MNSRFVAYLTLLFQPFFRWWWAAVTGVASILGVLVTPQVGVVLKPSAVCLMTFGAVMMGCLTLSTLIQGWKLDQNRFPDLRVVAVQKTKEYGGEYVVVLRGDLDAPTGTLVELRRPLGETDTLFALIELRPRTIQGNFPGVPIWTSPAHQRDLTAGRLAVSELVVVTHVRRDTLERLPSGP